MLGLKREIIKARDAEGCVGGMDIKRFGLELQQIILTSLTVCLLFFTRLYWFPPQSLI